MFEIKLNFDFNGEYLSLKFIGGIGHTDNPVLADKFRRRGYTVTEEEVSEAPTTFGLSGAELAGALAGEPVLNGLKNETPIEPADEADSQPENPLSTEADAEPAPAEPKSKKAKAAKE